MCAQTLALVGARWLADAVRAGRVGPALRVLDTSWYLPAARRDARAEYGERHIPGASFFDVDACSDRASPYDHMLPTERAFAQYVGALGVGSGTHVVVYDASPVGSFSAPRLWWMFRAFGHRAVSVLDGGLTHWLREGHPVSSDCVRPQRAQFDACLDRSFVKSYEDVLDNLEGQRFQLVDARAQGRFRGLEPEPRVSTEPGHIPGSINIPFTSLLDSSGLVLPPQQLADLFQKAGVDLSRPICASCGSGVTACHVALAAHLCGHPGVSVYDGSWCEWFARAAPEHVVSEGRGKRL